MFRKGIGLTIALTAMLAVLASSFAMPAAAQAQTIHAEIGRCSLRVDQYQVQLQTHIAEPLVPRVPRFVTIDFADGSSANAAFDNLNIAGAAYYYLWDTSETYRHVEPVAVYATFDPSGYGANWSFKMTAWPCDPTPEPQPEPTYAVSGTILQHGNQKPVEGLTVCLVELDLCDTTDAGGSFSIAGVESGTYTLVSDGPVYKLLTTTVTVDGADTYVDLIQFRGGGRN